MITQVNGWSKNSVLLIKNWMDKSMDRKDGTSVEMLRFG
jgi:hypothetical protein